MAAMKASSLSILQYSSTTSRRRGNTKATINLPKRVSKISLPQFRTNTTFEQLEKQLSPNVVDAFIQRDPLVVAKLYAILEAVADRIEMHKNIGDQRDNWNSLFLSSINALTLAAATMGGIASISHDGDATAAMTFSSTVMYVAATGMLSVVNKIQPSQLAEEQRNATRLFKQLHNQIQTILSIGNPTAIDVKEMMDKVLALDKAFPLPLLGGAMLDKFPATVEPAVWWPQNINRRRKQPTTMNQGYNGWNGKLEEEMREVVKVIKLKDEEDYLRLGVKALKLNKFLAISAPLLTAMAAVTSATLHDSHGSWAAVFAALATVANSLEHGGQVGMVFEMYRSNAGFFKLVQESIQSNLGEDDLERRENGEMMEMKVALQLGRSLSELRNLAQDSSVKGEEAIDEFASKLF